MLSHSDNVPNLWSIFAIQFLYFVAIGMILPIYPEIVIGTTAAGDDPRTGGTLWLVCAIVNAFFEFLSAGALGALSDVFGRKPFLMMASLGQVFDFFIAGLAASDSDSYSLSLTHGFFPICLARSVAGLCGNLQIFTRAYIADVSEGAQTTLNLGKLFGVTGIAVIVGPILGALAHQATGVHRAPMWMAAGCNLINMVIASRMKESLRQEHRSPLVWGNANPVAAASFFLTRRFLVFFGLMSLLDSLSNSLFWMIQRPYELTVYNYTPAETSKFFVFVGISVMITFIFFLKPIIQRFGEFVTLRIGYILTCVGYCLFALIFYTGAFDPNFVPKANAANPLGDAHPGRWLAYCVVPIFCLGFISNPTQVSIASRCVKPTEQGTLQGGNGSLETLGKIIGPLVGLVTFEWTARAGHPNMIFWVAAVLMLPGVYIAFKIRNFMPQEALDCLVNEQASLDLQVPLDDIKKTHLDNQNVAP